MDNAKAKNKKIQNTKNEIESAEAYVNAEN